MKTHTQEISLRTSEHSQMRDITAQVAEVVAGSGVRQGLTVVHVPHTTAAVTVNENADADVPHDILAALEQAVPWRQEFHRHGEGNAAAHVKSSLIGCSQTLLVDEGRLVLGTWQGIFFCEFDGPRSRKVFVRVMGD
jgi:secondary thiamine-phosphate synthase enzyme